MKREYLVQAQRLIKLYREGSDLTSDQLHILTDTAAEKASILDNVVHQRWFARAIAENIEALGGLNQGDLK